MSSNFNFKKINIDQTPFYSSDIKIDLYKLTEHSIDTINDLSFNSNSYEIQENYKKQDSIISELSEPCSSFDQASCELIPTTSDSNRLLIHNLEIEKETWRVESLKNGLKIKEYERINNELKEKIKNFEKSTKNFNDSGFVNIPKNEYAQINYNRKMLEKEVNSLKVILDRKDEEIEQIRREVKGSEVGKNVLGSGQGLRKGSALCNLDGNALGLRREEKEVEKQDLNKKLIESLRVNDSLTKKIKDLQEKIRNLESERSKNSPDTCNSAKRNTRTSSITSFSQLKKYEAEQDLELYIKKYKEAVLEIEKLESINKENFQVIENLHIKLNNKKEKISSLLKSQQSLSSTIKSLEHQLISIKSQKDSEIEQKKQEIINLKHALDSIHKEKQQQDSKLQNNEDLKSKLVTVLKSLESSKSNESKLNEELNKLESIKTSQATQLASLNSRLCQIEFMNQTLESNYAASSKSLHEKEAALLAQIQKNSKLSSKVQKMKQKINKSKNSNQNNFNDYKDMTINFMEEKKFNKKITEQNSELRFTVKSLEENREKLIEKIEDLSKIKSELEIKLNSTWQNGFEKLNSINSIKENKEKYDNELNLIRFEFKKKNEDFILAKAETRKLLTDVSDLTSKLKRSLDQEEFLLKQVKTSETEIKRLNEKIKTLYSQLEDRDKRAEGFNAELVSAKAQINLVSGDLKKFENSCRLLDKENYALKGKIDELGKNKSEPGYEASFKEEYFKLVRAYQYLNEEFCITRANLDQKKADLMETKKNVGKDPALIEAHLESLQIKLEGVLNERVSLERKVEFYGLEKIEFEKNIKKLKDELEMKDRKVGNGEMNLVEIQKYKSEIRRLENEQEKLNNELGIASNKINPFQNPQNLHN